MSRNLLRKRRKAPHTVSGVGRLSVVLMKIDGMKYNPWHHVKSLGVSVGWHPLKHSNGLWLPSKRHIVLNIRLPEWAITPILAHEAVHAEYDDPADTGERIERRCDRVAAERLIDPMRLWELSEETPDYDRICIELGVTRPMLTEWVNSRDSPATYRVEEA